MVALYIVISILSGFGNVIGASYKYFLPAAFIVGVVAPRVAMYLLLFCAGYIDLFKKLMAMESDLYFADVFFILGVPPVMLLGICCGILAGIALGRINLDRRIILLFSLTSVVVGIFGISAVLRSGANFGTLKEIANSASYYGLMFAVPVLFPKVEDIFKLLRFFVIMLIPAAFHGLYHFHFGLFGFEQDYMNSGLSMNMDYLYSDEAIYGPFASQGALAGTMAIAASICAFSFLTPKALLKKVAFPPRWIAGCLVILFMAAAIFSLKRFPVTVLPFTVIGYFLIRNRFGTAFAYVGAISSAIGLIAMSEVLAQRLPDWQQNLDSVIDRGGNDTSTYLFKIRTLNTRLEDFAYLKESENWEPFGTTWFKNSEPGEYGVHSLVVKIFLRYGWVPIGGVMMILMPGVVFLHMRLLRRNRDLQQRLFIYMTAMAISMFLAAALGAAFFTTFPIPVLFGFCLGVAVTTGILPPRAALKKPVKVEPEPIAPLQPPVPRRA